LNTELVEMPPTPKATTLIPSRYEMSVLTEIANAAASGGIPLPPSCHTPQACLIKMLYGREMGLAPMTSLYEIDIIEGTASLPARIMVALVRRRDLGDIRLIESTDVRAKIVAWTNREPDKRHEFEWSLDHAKRAGLLGRKVWIKYPKDMLFNRATSQACRMLFPEVFAGIAYTTEELGGDDVDEPIDVEFVDMTNQTGVKMKPQADPVTTNDVKEAVTPQPEPEKPKPEVEEKITDEDRIKSQIKILASDTLKLSALQWASVRNRWLPNPKAEGALAKFCLQLGMLAQLPMLREELGITETGWKQVLERKGATQDFELSAESVVEIYDKLSKRVTPFKLKEIASRTNGNTQTPDPQGN
jgi:hypothetical protein